MLRDSFMLIDLLPKQISTVSYMPFIYIFPKIYEILSRLPMSKTVFSCQADKVFTYLNCRLEYGII